MKAPVEWLKEFFPVKVKTEDVISTLTDIGLEVETCNDNVLDISLPANRADVASMLGLAREFCAAKKMELLNLEYPVIEPRDDASLHVKVDVPEKCPRYLCRIINNIKQVQTPDFVVKRLLQCGINPISMIVDLTNYVMLETGQPLHAFDLEKIVGKIVVRNAIPGEVVELLNDKTISLDADDLVIADDIKVLALAGVMGTKAALVTSTTNNVVVECAYFVSSVIRPMVKRYKLSTESAYRFERNICPQMQVDVMKRISALILTYAEGVPSITNHFVSAKHIPKQHTMDLNIKYVQKVIGSQIDISDMLSIFRLLGFDCAIATTDSLTVTVPSFRVDVEKPIDLVEEIARIYGLNNIPAIPASVKLQFLPISLDVIEFKKFLVARGYNETINYSFIARQKSELFIQSSDRLELVNPISQELAYMRPSLIPGLIQTVAYNQNRNLKDFGVKLFEFGLCFNILNDEIKQQAMVAGVISGRLLDKNWVNSNDNTGFYDIKNDVLALLAYAKQNVNYVFKDEIIQGYTPGMTAKIYTDINQKQEVGFVAAVHPEILNVFDIKHDVYVFEIKQEFLINPKVKAYTQISKFPAVQRDLALTVNSNLPAFEIQNFIKQSLKDVLQKINVFDVYIGDNIPKGKKSLALSLTLQHNDYTFSVNEVNDLLDKLIKDLEVKFDALIR